MSDQTKQSDKSAAHTQDDPSELEALSPGQRAMIKRGQQVPPSSAWKRTVITLVIIVAAGALIIGLLPKGIFSDDLSQIGAGTPVAVLVYEPAHPTSIGVMDLMRAARRDNPGVTFLVATSGTPEGQAFIRHFNMPPTGALLFFDAQGQPGATLLVPDSVEAILAAAAKVVPQH